MSVASELEAMSTNIGAAYDAVNGRGGTLPANKNLDNLPTAIGTISGGGGDRPANWLKMPTDANIANNEIYFLLEMSKDRTEDYLAKWGINASANYDIEFGTTVNGAFVVDPTYSKTNLAPGAYTYHSLIIPMSIFHTTGETKQVIMRVKTSGNITSVSLSSMGATHALNKRTIEIKGRATNLTYFNVGTNSAGGSAYALRYCTLLGTNNVTSLIGAFDYCYSLLEVSFDTSNVTNFSYAFRNCASLTTAPQLDTSSGTNFDRMFAGCTSLTSIPQLDTSGVTNFANMFDGCYSLTKADFSGYDFSSATNMGAFTGSNTYLDGGGKIYLPNKDKFPVAGILGTNAFTMKEDNTNPINYIISDTSGMIPLQTNGTSIFGTAAYVYVYVPDDLLATYQADAYWATLGARLKGLSELSS